jgi:succinate dehydrogenase/fumarate reductase flavoprotein subunit
VQAFNDAANAGMDPSFGKGEAPLDRFNGDPSHEPNPCLGAVRAAPFIALRVFAADAASSAGLATDGDGRVLGTSGAPLEGLYACGNDAASVMRGTYPGPGATLGPALVFGYRVGRHAAARAHRSTESLHYIASAVQVALQETGN